MMKKSLNFALLSLTSFVLFANEAWASRSLPIDRLVSVWSGELDGNGLEPWARSRSLKTEGAGRPSFVLWDLGQPTDVRGAQFLTWLKFNRLSEWRGLELRLSEHSDFRSFQAIPIRRYTDPDFNWLQQERWQRVSLSQGEAWSQGEVRLDRIRYVGWYVEGETSAGFQVELSDLEIRPRQSPGLVSFTFDDGYKEHLTAAKIMDRFGLRGTAYVMPREIGVDSRFLTQKDLSSLIREYGWGVSAHHAVPFTLFSVTSLEAEIQWTLEYLQRVGAGAAGRHLAYPLGKTNESVVMPPTRRSFRSARIAGGGAETLPPADWHRLRVVNMTPALDSKALSARLTRAQENGEWLILMFHYLVDREPKNDLEYRLDEFKKVTEMISRSGVEVLPVHEAWEKYGRD